MCVCVCVCVPQGHSISSLFIQIAYDLNNVPLSFASPCFSLHAICIYPALAHLLERPKTKTNTFCFSSFPKWRRRLLKRYTATVCLTTCWPALRGTLLRTCLLNSSPSAAFSDLLCCGKTTRPRSDPVLTNETQNTKGSFKQLKKKEEEYKAWNVALSVPVIKYTATNKR